MNTADDLVVARDKLPLMGPLVLAIGLMGLVRCLPSLTLVGVMLPLDSWALGWVLLLQLGLRTAFLVKACGLSRAIGSKPLPFGTAGVLFGLLVPFYNWYRPFQIARQLVEASTTSDLPPVLAREESRFDDYRAGSARERIVEPPAIPTPAILAWQLVVVCSFFIRWVSPAIGAFVAVAVVVLEVTVFMRLNQRFRARLGHLTRLAEAQSEARA